ncbi:MAG TPA: substrate-binding domain-containing protein [Candidatus Acidoferrum sp.]|jgi:ribose transport system substrate-binding protein|nr:substrate-binding domain-containing protein [Candidatus Acidoferrum sp.]
MRFKSMGVFTGLALGVIGLSSCQTAYHEDRERYVFVASNIHLPYWEEAQAGLMDAAKQMGVKAELAGPEKFDPQEQLKAFQAVVNSKPAGIMISVTRPDLLQDAIDGAVAQGIPVITVDSDAPTSKRLMFVGTDNFRAGMESGKRMGEILKGQGQLVVVTIPGQLNLDERARGMNEALKKYPGIKLAQTIDDKGDPRVANDNVSALLKAKAKIDGIICLEASGGSGAAEALHRVDAKIPIVGFDKDPETLDWIDRDGITATVTQKPYVMAYYAIKFADDLHHNAVHEFKDWRTAPAPAMPSWVDTGTVVVDKSNVKVFREALAAHPKPL